MITTKNAKGVSKIKVQPKITIVKAEKKPTKAMLGTGSIAVSLIKNKNNGHKKGCK